MQIHSGPDEAHQLRKVGSHDECAFKDTRINFETTVGRIDFDSQKSDSVVVIVVTDNISAQCLLSQ